MRRVSLDDAQCPVARALDAIGDWWSLLIIRDAFDGLCRFGEFERSLGVAKNILTVRLRKLVTDGILKTAPAADGSRHQEYLLTEKGLCLFHVIVGLRQWAEEYSFRKDEMHSVLIDREKKRTVRKLELRSRDGRLLGPHDTVIKKTLS